MLQEHELCQETAANRWIGRSVERFEDATLLTGRGRFIDDLGMRPGTLHAAILRSPHAHAAIRAIRSEAARRTGLAHAAQMPTRWRR